MTLREAAMGRAMRISGFQGLTRAEASRLAALGLSPDLRVVKLLRTPLRDPVECLAGTRLLAVEARLLDRILVSP